MPPESLTLQQLTTVAGIGVATSLVCEVIWRTAAASDAIKSRFGPILAIGVGIAIGIIASLVLGISGQDLAQAVVNGVVGGLTGIGLYDVVTSKAGVTA